QLSYLPKSDYEGVISDFALTNIEEGCLVSRSTIGGPGFGRASHLARDRAPRAEKKRTEATLAAAVVLAGGPLAEFVDRMEWAIPPDTCRQSGKNTAMTLDCDKRRCPLSPVRSF